MKRFNVQWLLWLALSLAMAGSLKHLAAVFASIDGNNFMGWLQAVAIDAGLFALAYSIRQRKTAKRSVKPLWFGVTLFTAISIYGNLSYGLLATTGRLPGWIAAIKPYILAGSLPILVLFLSELLSDDRHHAQAQATAPNPAQVITGKTEIVSPDDTLADINRQRQTTKQNRLAELAALLHTAPDKTNTELADLLGVSRGTIRNYRAELNGNGVAYEHLT